MNNIGIIGMGTMGQNLALNLSDHDYKVAVFNRSPEVVQEFLETNKRNKKITGFSGLKDFASSLDLPRKIILLVTAGDAVDQVIEEIKPYIQSGDILIDGGNSNYLDTERRIKLLNLLNISFLGLGISGGESGARHGASFMAGGNKNAYDEMRSILENIAALDAMDGKCVSYFGEGGAGHFVKMIHNGIEYIDMQLLADFYFVLKYSQKDNTQIANIFSEWNEHDAGSYLLEISAKILQKKDEDGTDIIEKIMDVASHKGTGQWASVYSLENEIASYSFASSVYYRYVSSQKDIRTILEKRFPASTTCVSLVPHEAEKAYLAAKTIGYIQGLEIIMQASLKYNWIIDMSECIRVWQGGCIIRAKLLDILYNIYKKNEFKNHLLDVGEIVVMLNEGNDSLHLLASEAIRNHLPIPGITSALDYLDSYTRAKLPANLIAAQRDYFGGHKYKRWDKEGDFHTEWD